MKAHFFNEFDACDVCAADRHNDFADLANIKRVIKDGKQIGRSHSAGDRNVASN